MGRLEGTRGVRGTQQGDLAAGRAFQANQGQEGCFDRGTVERIEEERRRLRQDAQGAESGHRDHDHQDAQAVLRDAGQVRFLNRYLTELEIIENEFNQERESLLKKLEERLSNLFEKHTNMEKQFVNARDDWEDDYAKKIELLRFLVLS